MPNKNKSRNSFYFFMKELQQKQAAAGCIYTMKNLPGFAHPKWKNMSVAERQPYEEMARKYKNDPSLRGGKLASDGTRVEDNLREIEERDLKKSMMMTDIRTYLNVDNQNDEQLKAFVSKKMFYFISFNILCNTETEFIPNEVGVTEYSIERGINREYHKLIYPGRIPVGYAGQAKKLSEEKHEIDMYSPEEGSERDMAAMFRNIKRFINPQDEDDFPPLFCAEEDMEQTSGCLYWLASRARSRDEFRIWNSKYLLLELRAASGHALPSHTTAKDILNSPSFTYTPSARCHFHNEKDNHNCALAYVKRLCYLISDAVCKLFEVELTEKHLPTQYSEDSAYVVTMPNNSSRNVRGPVAPTSVRLDQRNNYYQNEVEDEDQFAAAAAAPPPPVPAPVAQPTVPRQPATDCIAAQMARLGLNTAAAARPGLGIGRGQRRVN